MRPIPWITAPATGSTTSPARLKPAPSIPSRNLFLSRTAASSLPVRPNSSSVLIRSGIASQLSAKVVMVLGDTNTSAMPVPAVVRAARPALVWVKALGAVLPNDCAALPNHVRAAGIAVPDCKALRALSALETRLNTPNPGVAYVVITSATLPAERSGTRPRLSFTPSKVSVTFCWAPSSIRSADARPAAPSSVKP